MRKRFGTCAKCFRLGPFRNDETVLLEYFDEIPEIKAKFHKIWTILTKIDTFFAKRDPSDIEIEEGAKSFESFGEIFPMEFKEENLTRKMVDLKLVMPKQIREQKIVNKMLCLEQEGEHIHQIFNSLGETSK